VRKLATGCRSNGGAIPQIRCVLHARTEILTAAFWAAIAELTTAGVEISQADLAKRILDRAAEGIFDVDELK
jgi:hypothetical protein